MTARENSEVRDEVIDFGVSQIDAGTKLEIGGYNKERKGDEQAMDEEQFKIGDTRSLDDVIRWLLEKDYIPSFCTSCYRVGRTGEHFMEFAIPGFIKKFCTRNALLTLAEYLEDYSSERTKDAGYALIERELSKFPDGDEKNSVIARLRRIREEGMRDMLY